ncbi:hypothetical protein TNCV_4543451 [Trichonephila clavipes]|nr:hypothetical protein TNCV_4543451 [Trichonephila clavipes]
MSCGLHRRVSKADVSGNPDPISLLSFARLHSIMQNQPAAARLCSFALLPVLVPSCLLLVKCPNAVPT